MRTVNKELGIVYIHDDSTCFKRMYRYRAYTWHGATSQHANCVTHHQQTIEPCSNKFQVLGINSQEPESTSALCTGLRIT